MKKFVWIGSSAVLLILAAVALWLKTPAPAPFDREAALAEAANYNARIIRDRFGVPHIYGETDADVAFGLAYAHAEDDWATIEDVLFFSRGELAERKGEEAAIPDYLIGALRVRRDVRDKYERDLAPETRAIVEAFAAGANLWCAEERGRCSSGAAPVTPYDIVAGFVARTPFFYGLDEQLTAIFEGEPETVAAAEQARAAFLKTGRDTETGSNAIAVAPSRSADGHTRLMVNSHQPYTGPVAWYEARLKSEEGWDMIGGVFPGAPVILHGAGPHLGWAHTVNKPDLVDVYRLTVDDLKKPTQYEFDGAWRDFEVDAVEFRVKLFGPFSLPVKRRALHSVHGPVFVTDHGVYAISYAGAGEIRTVEQWYRMNKARNFAEWRSAMEMGAMPSLNAVYGDREGNIAYFYNAAIPIRADTHDPAGVLPGDTSQTVWRGRRPFNVIPQVVNPASGYVVNANNNPFEASGVEDNPDPADFPAHYGVDMRTTNRGLRTQDLYGADPSITEEEFLAYKVDHFYAEESRAMKLIARILEEGAENPDLAEELAVLRAWDGSTARDSRSAPLAVLTARRALGRLLNGEDAETSDPIEALKQTSADLKAGFGRIDPEWGEVVRLKRGEISLAVDGGPDILRAVYPTGDPAEGAMAAAGGDTYILYADWPSDGGARGYPEIRTIHQFGSATLDETSPHYADQAPLFAAGEWKTPPMTFDALLTEATADYRVGRE